MLKRSPLFAMLSGALGLAAVGLLVYIRVLGARADLNAKIQSILADKLLSQAAVGIEIVRLGKDSHSAQVLFRHNADVPLLPASNLKLITTSAVLDRLGTDFKFRTLLVGHGNDLILIGDGDPTLGDPQLLCRAGWDVTSVFADWADILKKRGILSVGNILVDDSIFDETLFHPHWPVEQAEKHYAAEVAGVSLNINCLDFVVHPSAAGLAAYTIDPPTCYVTVSNDCRSGGSDAVSITRTFGTNNILLSGSCQATNHIMVSVHDPSLYAATVLAETLAGAGIKITGKVLRDRTIRGQLPSNMSATDSRADSTWTLLAVHETPLPQVVTRANKDSVSVYVESLCKRLGFAVTGQSGSWSSGTAAVGAFLAKVGVDGRLYHLDDGCGLSKEDVVAAHAIVSVLIYDHFAGQKDVFFNSLSVAGSDGTLVKRFRRSDLRDRVFAKSGSMNDVSNLSGYLHAKDDQWYVFSILMNGFPIGSIAEARGLQEAIVEALDNSVGTSGPIAMPP